MSNITINKNQTVNNGQFTFDSYTPITCYIVFYFIVRLDKPYPISGTKTFHKILRGTSAKKVKKHCPTGYQLTRYIQFCKPSLCNN